MADVIGFDNNQEQKHIIKNTLDGNLSLFVYADRAKGKTSLKINGTEVCASDAGEGMSPFICGRISIPRGEFTVEAESGCVIGRLLLTENAEISTPEEFDLQYMNRKMAVFEHDQVDYSPEIIEMLQRHGFLYDQPRDTADGKEPSGVPLGGMGCGKLEITPDGMFTAFTGNNNQDCPIYRMPGSFMALSAGGTVRIIRNDPLGLPYQPASEITSDLEFPFARISCSDSKLPVSAYIEAFSSHIPGNAGDSSLPCVFFKVTMENISGSDTAASFCFSWENIINVGGSMVVHNKGKRLFPLCYHTWNCSYPWSDRRSNKCSKVGQSLIFSADEDKGNPSSFGRHLLWCSESDAEYYPDRSILPEDEALFGDIISGSGGNLGESGSEFRAGACIVRRKLKKGGKAEFSFILVWYMPVMLDENGKDYGVEYTNRFSSIEAVLDYCVTTRKRLYDQTIGFNDILNRSSLPEWFRRRLLDDRFVVNTCSWYDRYGNFSINEAPTGMCGCLGTLDQRTASQVYYTSFFPELDERELELFRQSQGEDGMCAHEIGFATIKLEARPFSKWPDLVDSYIIQVFHHYQRTGDIEFLRRHWPNMKKAVEWTLTLDDEKCGIPYICAGRGTTYDNQFWEGVNSFIATMQIVAYRIGARAAEILGDESTADQWDKLALKAHGYRMEHLYNEKEGCFSNAYNPAKNATDGSCFIASLAGEWAVMRSGIIPFLTYEQIGDIAFGICERCVGDNGITDQGGRRDETDGFMQYPLAYLASASLYGGNPRSAWRLAEVTERVITQPGVSTHFDQGLTYAFSGKRHGLPYYMTSPASWNMLEALAGLKADLGSGILSLSPYISQKYRIPVFLTGCCFEMICSDSGDELCLEPVYSMKENRFTKLIVAGKWTADGKSGVYNDKNTEIDCIFDPGKDRIVLKRV